MRGAQAGSASDLEALFRAYWPRSFRAAYLVVHDSAAAEDIAQEAFLAAIRSLDRFDRRRPFGPWLHRIVVNRAIDWTRAHKLRAEAELDETLAAAEAPDTFDDGTLAKLSALPPEHRAVIVLSTCSSTPPARSPTCSTCLAEPSTPGCGADSTRSPRICDETSARACRDCRGTRGT